MIKQCDSNQSLCRRLRIGMLAALLLVDAMIAAAAVDLHGWNDELKRIYYIGDLPVSRESPDFYPVQSLQADNENPLIKLAAKTSKEIRSNYVGATPPRLPRSHEFDVQPFKRVHIIDGDRQTLWMNRGQATATQEPVWVRIDLPYETDIRQVTLWPLPPDNGGWPANITVEVSRDGDRWDRVYHTPDHAPLPGSCPVELPFTPRPAKQIRVTVKDLRLVQLGGREGTVGMGYGLCVSGIDVLSPAGDNLALLSKGAGVTVSSTNYGYGDKRSMHDMLWPIHYDLGIKHIKIAYWDSTLNWHYVEMEKGKYHIDPRTDAAITESVENGVEVYMTLAYGNWLYADEGGPPMGWRFWQFPFQKPPAPLTEEAIEAFCNYCRFIVKHFKGRIHVYEIWNEQNIGYSWPPGEVDAFCALTKRAAKAIRQADPEAKVMLGGVCFLNLDYFEKMFKHGVAEVVDVISWHPYQWEVAPEESYSKDATDPFDSYRHRVSALKAMAKKYGYTGNDYHANEATWVSPYPAPDFGVPGGPVTEMTKAKYISRGIALHADMDIPFYYNETWNTGIVYWDVSLLRATASADPASPVWCQPAYYALRTMATVTDGYRPAEIPVSVSGIDADVETCRLRHEDGSFLIGVWLNQRAVNVSPVQSATIRIGGFKARSATGINPINGLQQEFMISFDGPETVISGCLIQDYPLLLKVIP